MKSCLAKSIDAIYCSELQLLGRSGAYRILEEAHSKWDLTSYAKKGVLFFPHAYLLCLTRHQSHIIFFELGVESLEKIFL